MPTSCPIRVAGPAPATTLLKVVHHYQEAWCFCLCKVWCTQLLKLRTRKKQNMKHINFIKQKLRDYKLLFNGLNSILFKRFEQHRNFVFIHINKTAGMSVGKALGLKKQHLTAGEYKNSLGIRRWNKSFKFIIVRNPWDKVVSHYFHRVKPIKQA